MPIVPVRLAKTATGKRYFVILDSSGKTYCKGPVLRRAGFDAVFGPDKTFKSDRVDIVQVDLSEQLLDELIAQEK